MRPHPALAAAPLPTRLSRWAADEIEDYFNFGCSYEINASGVPLSSRRCPWGGSDEGFPAGWAKRYVQDTMIPELRDLVERYQPHYLYADGDWSGSDDFLETKPFLAWLFNQSPIKVTAAACSAPSFEASKEVVDRTLSW